MKLSRYQQLWLGIMGGVLALGIMWFIALAGYTPGAIYRGVLIDSASKQCRNVDWTQPFWPLLAKPPQTIDGQSFYHDLKALPDAEEEHYDFSTPYGRCQTDTPAACCSTLGLTYGGSYVGPQPTEDQFYAVIWVIIALLLMGAIVGFFITLRWPNSVLGKWFKKSGPPL